MAGSNKSQRQRNKNLEIKNIKKYRKLDRGGKLDYFGRIYSDDTYLEYYNTPKPASVSVPIDGLEASL